MRPYFERDGITIYHGKAEAVLPFLPERPKVAITDPPYNIGSPQRVSDLLSADRRLVGGDFGTFDTDAILPSEWATLMPDLVVSFYPARFMDRLICGFRGAGFEAVQDFHWVKPNPPVPMRSVGFSWGTESGLVLRRVGTRHVHNNAAGVSTNWIHVPITAGHERTEHPTQKPLRVMHWLVNHWSLAGDLIVDPFGGSGTTARACLNLGRRCVMVEQDERYCEIAARRLSQTVMALEIPA